MLGLYGRWHRSADQLGLLSEDQLVMCHHDAHARNFMIRGDQDRSGEAAAMAAAAVGDVTPFVLLDWEFAGMSHPAIELGNLICAYFLLHACAYVVHARARACVCVCV